MLLVQRKLTIPLRIHVAKSKQHESLRWRRNRGVTRAGDPEPLKKKAPKGELTLP